MLLSHYLFEGTLGRVGLVSDIVVYENYPPHYLINVLRSHRWVRGDWQLLPWLFGNFGFWIMPTNRPDDFRIKDSARAESKIQNPKSQIALIDRWKIADNLRRSLLSPALLLLFAAGWTVLPGSPLLWTAIGLITPAFSLITSVLTGFIHSIGSEEGPNWSAIVHPLRDNACAGCSTSPFCPMKRW